MEYKVVLNDAENKALSHVTYDPQEWIQSTISERCRVAIEEIVAKELERITSGGEGTISGSKETIVLNAPIKSGKEIQDEFEDQLAANS
jgi:rRNA-processing protein FCF1